MVAAGEVPGGVAPPHAHTLKTRGSVAAGGSHAELGIAAVTNNVAASNLCVIRLAARVDAAPVASRCPDTAAVFAPVVAASPLASGPTPRTHRSSLSLSRGQSQPDRTERASSGHLQRPAP